MSLGKMLGAEIRPSPLYNHSCVTFSNIHTKHKKEAIKMHFLRYILVLSFILKINEALKSCSETHDMLSVCLIGDKNYEDPVPAHLETWLYLNEIIKIDGKKAIMIEKLPR